MIQVGIIMGSNSDWPVMQHAARFLQQFGVAFEARVVSAHRTPDLMFEYAETARARGIKAIIAGAGGAAHLPGMVAAKTTVPVLGVPVPSKYLHGEDSLLSIVQMPKGVPVATFAIGEAGAANAALFAISLLANENAKLAQKLADFRQAHQEAVLEMALPHIMDWCRPHRRLGCLHRFKPIKHKSHINRPSEIFQTACLYGFRYLKSDKTCTRFSKLKNKTGSKSRFYFFNLVPRRRLELPHP